MKKYLFLSGIAFAAMLLVCLSVRAQSTVRQRQLLDNSWRFQLGDPADITNAAETNVAYYPEIPNLAKLSSGEVSGTTSETYMETLRIDPVATHMGENVSTVQTNFNDGAWRLVNLPHDWAVELPFNSSADGGHGYKPVGNSSFGTNNIGWYRRTFTLPANYANQTLWLEFDGVYRNCLVWFNGHILGRNVSGYSSFYFDITKYANPGGTNVLVVRVDASRFEGWFYEGAGIYRHVWLVETSPVHVAHWGTFVSSTVTNSNATLTAQTQLNNDSTNSVTCNLASTVLDPGGNTVTTAATNVTIAAGTNQVVTQTIVVTNPILWSLQSPNLYQLVSTVTQGSVTNDVYQTPFGVRTILFDPNNGLFLNGQRVPIEGMCNHQDHAGVGSALPDRIQYFRIERLKEMGVNVYRTSHNPPTPALLDACDQLGMLVLDENRRIGTNAEPMVELQRLILRDRNHPSIFCWSLANEEDLQGSSTGASVMQVMVNLAHQLDPSRKCTAAMNGGWGSGFSTVLDVQGFNYLHNANMDGFHNSFPSMPAFGTEEASTYFTRGIYANTSTYDSAYDVNKPGYGTTAEEWWQYYTARPWASGACVWTGFDYRGEPSPFSWPNISSEFGIIDTCGFPKDVFYYHQANWTGKTVLHIFPHWNWAGKEGQAINIWCFSDCDMVELFLNSVSQGTKTVNVQSHVEWNTPYAAGTLQAVGYRNGRAVITNTVATTGMPAGIVLLPDRSTILADGMDVSLITVSVVDAQGRIVPTATNTINFSITGGSIIGAGNGDPASHEVDKAINNVWQRSVFNGLAQIIVQSTNQTGPVVLTATASGLSPTNVTITAATNLPPPAPPTGVAVAADNAKVWLSWDNVPGAMSYNVKRSTTISGPYTPVAAYTPNSYYTDAGLTNGTNYYYVVSAVNTNGESANSFEVNATPASLPPPATPTGLTAAPAGSTKISLSWNASPAATSYNIKRSTTNGGPYATIASPASNSYLDTGLTNTMTYYYVVSAVNSVGESINYAQVSATPGSPAPTVWFKADAIIGLTNNAKLGAWNDSSSSGFNAVNTTAAQQPTYATNVMNSMPVVRFNASSSNWLAFIRPVQDDFTIMCVFQSTQGIGTGTEFWSAAGLVNGEVGGSTSDFGTSLNTNGKILAGVGDGGTAASTIGFNDGAPHLLAMTRTESSGAVALYVDGVLASTVTANTLSLTAPSQLVLGAQQTLNNFFSGDIAEVKIFNSSLIDVDRQSLESALITKYGIGGTNRPSISSQPQSFAPSAPMYAGVPITFSVAATGAPPISYQWYQFGGGVTNIIMGATNASFVHLSQAGDTNGVLGFYTVAGNSVGSVTSSVANLTVAKIVAGTPGPISVQCTITNYSGFSGGFYLSPTDTAGVFFASNWNVVSVTPPNSAPGVTTNVAYMLDSAGVITPAIMTASGMSDGWRSGTVTGANNANTRMMYTFWKAKTGTPATLGAGLMRFAFTNLDNSRLYDTYIYLLVDTGSPVASITAGQGITNYTGPEWQTFSDSSNFVQSVDTTAGQNDRGNCVKLTDLSPNGTNAITILVKWLSAGNGFGVSGIQLVPVPPVTLTVGPQTNGQFSLSFQAQAYHSYVLQTSTNLTSWIPVLTNTPSSNALFFYTNTGATDPARFYRVKP